MTKNKTTRTERVKKAERDFKKHVKDSKRAKTKSLKKVKKQQLKSEEEYRFRQHMARLLSPAEETRFS